MTSSQLSDRQSSIPIDLDELTSRCMGRLELVDRVLTRFQQSLDRELEELEDAVLRDDREGVARTAHRIKGTSVTVAAHGLHRCAERLQQSAESQFERIHEHLAEFQHECSRLSELIDNR